MAITGPLETGHFTVSRADPRSLSEGEREQWDALFARQARPANVFLARPWVLGWYDEFVASRDQRLLLVRHRTSGELVGVAPFHEQALPVGGVPVARRLVLVGAGHPNAPLELPGVLAKPEVGREVVRAVVAATSSASPGWCEIALTPDQSWFEPEWVLGTGRPVAFYEHQRARACVVLRTAASWEETRSALKRNVKESIRRSTNRLRKDDRQAEVRTHSGSGLDRDVVDTFLGMHRTRSTMSRATVRHPDAYADPRLRRLMHTVLPRLAEQKLATVFELVLDGRVVASQLALHGPGVSYVHSSGFEPDVWDLGPVTLLHSEVVRHAIDRGDSVVNFSPGPNVSKLRWSTDLWVTQEFSYGAGPRPLRWTYGLYAALSAVRGSSSAIAFARTSSQPVAQVRRVR